MKKKIKVKSYTRNGYDVSGPIKVNAHTRELEVKKASNGNNKSHLNFKENYKKIYGFQKKSNSFEKSLLPKINEEVSKGNVTYRGIGLGKLNQDFENFTGESGTKIKYLGKEFIITDKDFESLGGIKRIKFKAPKRRLN